MYRTMGKRVFGKKGSISVSENHLLQGETAENVAKLSAPRAQPHSAQAPLHRIDRGIGLNGMSQHHVPSCGLGDQNDAPAGWA